MHRSAAASWEIFWLAVDQVSRWRRSRHMRSDVDKRYAVEDKLTPGDAFTAWLAPHRGVMLAIAAREIGSAEAEDIVQEATLRAWQKLHLFDADRGSARAWLVAIVLDRCRRHRVRHRQALFERPAAAESQDLDARLDMEKLVRSLPNRQRQVVTLFYLADLSVDEIARTLGLSTSAVKTHLLKARDALQRKWNGNV